MQRPNALATSLLSETFLSPRELQERGVDRHAARRLVEAGELVRLRNGRYVRRGACDALVRAGRIGGRLDCVSLLGAIGVFVVDRSILHVQFERGTSRLPVRPAATVAHWRRSRRARAALTADLIEALAQSVRCQAPRDAVATLDSAWHQGLIDESDLAAVFARLPERYRPLRSLLDPRSESGPESLMRLILRGLGCSFDVQVEIAGVGRVDFVVDGWLIIECDSKAHHEGWDAQRRDRRRDIAAARAGYTTIRPLAEDILFHREQTLDDVKSILAHGPRPSATQNSSKRGAKRRTAAPCGQTTPA
ncbi:type IV toxin-antitoxin system AbiEi family antitoxin domain-containing protein [Microbacterium sulfonylureivorans]|uniref:type IV toxin-antitoxin system AbiEi family antitoxin domain-containing protein n=1 Tax=Microbacterium sulfonylureivorans TaxID=2486854 RepID=UPI0013DF0B15|nr:type IV toxin-antitoxin system AbiEi family antitoxin domain-containing protein [Microbacterium sulfonylureivorans]